MGNYGNKPKRSCNRMNSKGKESVDACLPLWVCQPRYFVLFVYIKKAYNVDALAGVFKTLSEFYRVDVVESRYLRQFHTPSATGKPEPSWHCCTKITFDEFPSDEFLFFEVMKLRSGDDPGPSSGNVVVGRTKVPIPNRVGESGWQRYKLIRLSEGEKEIGGFIEVAMEIRPAPTP